MSIRSTSTWRSRRSVCSTSRIGTPLPRSSSGPWARREIWHAAARWSPTWCSAISAAIHEMTLITSLQEGGVMDLKIDRRSLIKAGAALAATRALPALAQARPTLRFAAVFSEKDIRADMIRMLAKDIATDFNLEPFYGGALFKQGTELVAL